MTVVEPEGLRERKKRRTRREISDVATRLFFEHGFEAVTLAQIAEAAEVSVKTIFNHFGGKDDLYFDRAQELRDALAETITGRPAGAATVEALRRLLAENLMPFPGAGWASLRDPEQYAHLAAFLAVQDRSAALRARRLVLDAEIGAHLAGVLAAELGDDPAVEVLAEMIMAAMRLRDHALRTAIAARAPADDVEHRVRAVVDEVFRRLEAAFADVDRVRA